MRSVGRLVGCLHDGRGRHLLLKERRHRLLRLGLLLLLQQSLLVLLLQ